MRISRFGVFGCKGSTETRVDAFSTKSRQVVVRDEVAFSQGIDPTLALLLAAERMSGKQRVQSQENQEKEHSAHDAGLLPTV